MCCKKHPTSDRFITGCISFSSIILFSAEMADCEQRSNESAVVVYIYSKNLKRDHLAARFFWEIYTDGKPIYVIDIESTFKPEEPIEEAAEDQGINGEQQSLEVDNVEAGNNNMPISLVPQLDKVKFWKNLPRLHWPKETDSNRKKTNFWCELKIRIPKFSNQRCLIERKGEGRDSTSSTVPLIGEQSPPVSPVAVSPVADQVFPFEDDNIQHANTSGDLEHRGNGPVENIYNAIVENDLYKEHLQQMEPNITHGNGMENFYVAQSHEDKSRFVDPVANTSHLAETNDVFETRDATYEDETKVMLPYRPAEHFNHGNLSTAREIEHGRNVDQVKSMIGNPSYRRSVSKEKRKPSLTRGDNHALDRPSLSRVDSYELNRPMLARLGSSTSSGQFSTFSSMSSETSNAHEESGETRFSMPPPLVENETVRDQIGDTGNMLNQQSTPKLSIFPIRKNSDGQTGSPESGYSTSVPLTANSDFQNTAFPLLPEQQEQRVEHSKH